MKRRYLNKLPDVIVYFKLVSRLVVVSFTMRFSISEAASLWGVEKRLKEFFIEHIYWQV